MNPTVRVRAIGAAEVLVGGHRIRPDSSVLFALALYLACTAGERVARARLVELLWPGMPDPSRRHALRQLLYRLRQNGLALALDGEELLIDPAHVDSDIAAVLDAAWPDSAPAAAVLAAGQVLPGYVPPTPELYREWLEELIARIAAQYRRAVLRQIACARQEGRWGAVEEWARQCLAADPLNEEATLARAEATAMAGAKTQALAILDEYRRELGPRSATIGLPVKILRRRISEQRPLGALRHAEPVPLVGRTGETKRLNELLARTLSGHRAAVLIVGAPGIGKTALAQELVESALMRGWRSIAARLHASDAHRPLAAFVDLFSVLLQLPGALGCAPAALTQLQRLTQHGVAQSDDAPQSQEAEAVQQRIRTAAIDLLSAVCEEGPLIVLLEDLHWSDGPSRRLLQHLVERTSALPLLWLLTARPEARYADLRDVLGEETVESLRLGPLREDEAIALFRSLAVRSRQVNDAVLHDFASALTGGNPFFICEVARHCSETGSIHSLPRSLRALIHERVTRLPRVTQHVLHTCAVLGRYSSVPRIASVLEIGTAELLASIEDLDALGILGAGKDADALAMHDLWQEEMLASLRPASKQLIHHRCGAVLEAESRHTRSASMVWEASRHLIASGAHDRALSLLEKSAQHLLTNGLPVDAAQTFELAFRASTTDAERFRTVSGQVAALHRAASWTDLSEVIGQAIALSERCSDNSSVHTAMELLQTELLWRTETDSDGALQRALGCVRDGLAPAGHRASAGLIAARTASNLARWPELGMVHGVVRSLPVTALEDRACVLAVETIYHTDLGSLEEAISVAGQLAAVERELGSVRGLARALRFAAYPLLCVGDYERATELLQSALLLAEEEKLVEEAFSAADVLASINVERNDLRMAESWLARADSWASRIGAEYARKSLNTQRAKIALAGNDPERAALFVDADLDRHARDPLVRQRILNLSILARLFVARKDWVNLEIALGILAHDLELSSTTCRKDYGVASLAIGLVSLGRWHTAVDYVTDYVKSRRRDKSQPSAELSVFGHPRASLSLPRVKPDDKNEPYAGTVPTSVE
ncbi:MAG TPA: AAA family ATPase [Gemmatimonadaceae bacterium]|nr:AAA family ATPase [Gemmatimonadaceae bacterium]